MFNRAPAAILLLILGNCGWAMAEEPATPADDEDAKKFQAYAKETAAAYKSVAGKETERKLTLADQAILRWTNPLGGHKAHGEVFLWTDEGRPAAVLSLYHFTDKDGVVREHHEFCSLLSEPLSFTGTVTWAPQSGLEFQILADKTAPADSARQRLSQLRELAAGFIAEKTTRDRITRPLRVLPQPVHRYKSEKNGIIDGALFAVVEATDPEIFLILEARTSGEKMEWHYALARMTSVGLKASFHGKEVWNVDVLPWREALSRKDLPYTAFQVR